MLAHLCSRGWVRTGDVNGVVVAGKIRNKNENTCEGNSKPLTNEVKENSKINNDLDQNSTKFHNKMKPKILFHQMKKLALKSTDSKHNTTQQPSLQRQHPDVIDSAIKTKNNSSQSSSTSRRKKKKHNIDFDKYLTDASLEEPANIPMVISRDVVLRATGIFTTKDFVLAMGNVVNGVHKTDEWLFVQTSDGTEGYIPYSSCIPLGIKPSRISDVPAAWEINADLSVKKSTSSLVLNKTDTEKLFWFSDTVLGKDKVEKTVVVCDYWCKNKEQISVRRDETVTVIEKSSDDWLRVETVNGRKGLIPIAYTTLGKQYFV